MPPLGSFSSNTHCLTPAWKGGRKISSAAKSSSCNGLPCFSTEMLSSGQAFRSQAVHWRDNRLSVAGQNSGHLAQRSKSKVQKDRCSLTDPLEEEVINIWSLWVCRTNRCQSRRNTIFPDERHRDERGRDLIFLIQDFRHKP